MSKLIIVSNRLPMTISKEGDTIQTKQSVGGLATGLSSFYEDRNSEWIGWPGGSSEEYSDADKSEICRQLETKRCHPIFLSEMDLSEYYMGFSNQTLWPLFHYFPTYAQYEDRHWEAYMRVNQLFCDAVLDRAGPEDKIWIHDYQLLLLPGLLRKHLPNAQIGFFLHIPFPSSEIIRLLPWREELLTHMLGADLIGFHTFDYVRHFLASVNGLLGYSPIAIGRSVIPVDNRLVRPDAFPMGIDVQHFEDLAASSETQEEVRKIREKVGDRKIILSVDRLDYSKGMLHRLRAFETFLERHPDQRGKVTLILKAIASRSGIQRYDELKQMLDEAVGRVNGRFGTLDWVPVWYLFRFLPEETLSALYQLSDVALLTPLRDGMNLIAKEYLASKQQEDGVLILSELAGAARELQESIVVNPNNGPQIAEAIQSALTMDSEEIQHRCKAMRARLRDHDVSQWAEDFMQELEQTKAMQRALTTTRLRGQAREQILSDYQSSHSRLLLFDFDGTLVELADTPDKASPTAEVLQLLQKLSQDPANVVAVLSGRSRETMEKWFGDLPLRLGAEHGVWIQVEGRWERVHTVTNSWKAEIRSILNVYTRRTPGSRVEEKDYSLVWDYHNLDGAFGEIRSAELLSDLHPVLHTQHLDVLRGDGFLEIKSAGVAESEAVSEWIRDGQYDFVFSAGDDMSDEGVFSILPDNAYSVRIGSVPSSARFSLRFPHELLALLQEMTAE